MVINLVPRFYVLLINPRFLFLGISRLIVKRSFKNIIICPVGIGKVGKRRWTAGQGCVYFGLVRYSAQRPVDVLGVNGPFQAVLLYRGPVIGKPIASLPTSLP